MSHLIQKMFALACTLCATAACSQAPHAAPTDAASASGTDAVSTIAPAGDHAVSGAAGFDCGRVFTPNDAAGILAAPIKMVPDAYPIGCGFQGPDGSGVSVRIDSSFEMIWKIVNGRGGDGAKYVDLPGVGDQARRLASNGDEVMSRKGKLYCSADFSRQSIDANLDGEELARRLGALCNKLFAANP